MQDQELQYWRIFSRDDGSSTMERVNISMASRPSGSKFSESFSARELRVTYQAPGNDGTWHTASRRQLAVTLAGESEIETSDGQVLVVRPGVVTIVEDVTGKGHVTRSRGDEGRTVLFVTLGDDAAIG